MLGGKNVIFMADASWPHFVYILIFPFNDEKGNIVVRECTSCL